jgi:hypothetical protein
MNRKLWIAVLLGTLSAGAFVAWHVQAQEKAEATLAKAAQVAQVAQGGEAGPRAAKAQPPAPLPIHQVILFSSGVGYFQREGEVDGNARIDLAFPSTEINDLLKSLVLQDLAGGRVSAVSYDSHEPIDKTLRSFSLDLSSNPSFGELLNQARGEKVEVVTHANSTHPGTFTGTIVGMESQKQPAKDGMVDVELLNLLCADGVRSCPLSGIQRVRFLNPAVDSELKRALEVLAQSHDSQKKIVSISFTGQGRRPVRLGYVVENPIWKTSYRLRLDKNDKPFLQGWAIVENTSDDDWTNVRMSLVSGRPISFQMNLYEPLFIPRPNVEPELFASLRPPTYNGAMNQPAGSGGPTPDIQEQIQQSLDRPNRYSRANLATPPFGGFPNSPGAGLGGGLGGFGGAANFSPFSNMRGGNFQNSQVPQRLAYEELEKRRNEVAARSKELAKNQAEAILNLRQGVSSLATAEEVGDFYQYAIDHPVCLPRQKSALLPIVNQGIEGTKVSIFNEAVHAKFPLLGLKLKNTSGQHLMQGPITVYEGGSYAGDARLMDLQPNEERLLSYAMDLGMEVKSEAKQKADDLVAIKIVKGLIHATYKSRMTRTYLVKNRNDRDRTLIIEHPINTDWKLVTPEKPTERSRDMYRFVQNVPAGKSGTQEVVEELTRLSEVGINKSLDDTWVKFFVSSSVTSSKVKEALTKATEMRHKLSKVEAELAEVGSQLTAIREDQTRLRANLKEVPPTAAAYKRYLEKFDKQETEIEKLQEQTVKLRETAKQQEQELANYLAGLNVE